jgi:hypothetical protein
MYGPTRFSSCPLPVARPRFSSLASQLTCALMRSAVISASPLADEVWCSASKRFSVWRGAASMPLAANAAMQSAPSAK